jgi:hypothetical protein
MVCVRSNSSLSYHRIHCIYYCHEESPVQKAELELAVFPYDYKAKFTLLNISTFDDIIQSS